MDPALGAHRSGMVPRDVLPARRPNPRGGWPWFLAFAIASLAVAARVEVAPALNGVLVLTSLSQLDGHLPHPLDHLKAACASEGSSGTAISVPAMPGVLDERKAFLVRVSQLQERAALL